MNVLTRAMAADLARPAEEHLALALAHQRLGEKDLARQAYRRAVQAMKPVGEDAHRRFLIREAVRAVAGPGSVEASELLAAAAGGGPAELTDAIRKQPDLAAGYLSMLERGGCKPPGPVPGSGTPPGADPRARVFTPPLAKNGRPGRQ